MNQDDCRDTLESVRIAQVGVCKSLVRRIAEAAVSDKAAVIPIGERLEQEQDVLYAIEAALRFRCIAGGVYDAGSHTQDTGGSEN